MRLHVVAVVAVVVVVSGTGVRGREETSAQPYRPSQPGVTLPTLLASVSPAYPPGARHARIQGSVELEAIVRIDGTVGPVRVVKSLDQVYGLDDAAVVAARNWLFRPGQYRGKPAPVVVTLILDFKPSAPEPGGWLNTRPAESTPWNLTADEFLKGTYPEVTPGLLMPTLVRQVEPKYTYLAKRRKIEGTVIVEAVVMPDGTVGRARVVTSLDQEFGLDAAALDAVKLWRFEPAHLGRETVPVAVELVVEFHTGH
jgi:TonB family protein